MSIERNIHYDRKRSIHPIPCDTWATASPCFIHQCHLCSRWLNWANEPCLDSFFQCEIRVFLCSWGVQYKSKPNTYLFYCNETVMLEGISLQFVRRTNKTMYITCIKKNSSSFYCITRRQLSVKWVNSRKSLAYHLFKTKQWPTRFAT